MMQADHSVDDVAAVLPVEDLWQRSQQAAEMLAHGEPDLAVSRACRFGRRSVAEMRSSKLVRERVARVAQNGGPDHKADAGA